MAKKQYVRITSDGPTGWVSIVDVETGVHLESQVTYISIEIPPFGPFVATLTTVAEIDVVAEAKLEPMTFPAHDEIDHEAIDDCG